MCDRHEKMSLGCDFCHENNLDKFANFLKQYGDHALRSFLPSSQVDSPKPNLVQKQIIKNYIWITVNPRDGITLQELMKAIHKMYKKIWIDTCVYVFEIGQNGRHHSHGLIKVKPNSIKRTKCKELLANSVKHITTINNDHCFCYRDITEVQAREKLSYMQGLKVDEKQDAVHETDLWRLENNLENMYGDSPILLIPENL